MGADVSLRMRTTLAEAENDPRVTEHSQKLSVTAHYSNSNGQHEPANCPKCALQFTCSICGKDDYRPFGMHCQQCHSLTHDECLVCECCLPTTLTVGQSWDRWGQPRAYVTDTDHRRSRLFCSSACRQKAYRQRQREAAL